MKLFSPTAAVRTVTDLTPEFLRGMGVTALLLDADNTLALPDSQTPLPGTVAWTRTMADAGFRLVIMSNNSEERVRPFAAKFGLPFCPKSHKPLPAAFRRTARSLGTERGRCVAVGDQIFTDVLGANLAGMKSILLEPAMPEKASYFRMKRFLEKPVRRKIASAGTGGKRREK